jgi:hypothetical protein
MRREVRIAAQVVGIALITLGAVNGFWATKWETCTQGAADSMLAGFLNLPLYALGFAAIIAWPLTRWAWLLLGPALVGFVYHLFWTIRFSWHYLIANGAVCDLITGDGPYPFDTDEPMFLTLWIVLSAMIVAGTAKATRRSFARR